MASFECYDSAFDELEEQGNTLTVTCPDCKETFDITLDDLNSSVVCPHCNATVEIESK